LCSLAAQSVLHRSGDGGVSCWLDVAMNRDVIAKARETVRQTAFATTVAFFSSTVLLFALAQ
jgi:hypothetical protein